MKVSVVFGTRPELIKLASVITGLRTAGLEVELISTGQHDEMLRQMLDHFQLEPDFNLGLMEPGQGPGDLVGKGLVELGKILGPGKSDLVVVQGDTGSTLAGALAGFYSRIPVAHVEAGLRTGDLAQPFPEEGNRKLVDQISTLHFAATGENRKNLLSEGVKEDSVFVTGNTAIDAILSAEKKLKFAEKIPSELESCEGYFLGDGPRVLVTVHRRESFGDGIDSIISGLKQLAQQRPQTKILLPVHPNPAVNEPIREKLEGVKGVWLCEPLTYLGICYALMNSSFVLTDSGGLQEEAPSLDKPVLVLREKTERAEGVTAGCSRVIGTESDSIVSSCLELIDQPQLIAKMAAVENPYGDGLAGERVTQSISKFLDKGA